MILYQYVGKIIERPRHRHPHLLESLQLMLPKPVAGGDRT